VAFWLLDPDFKDYEPAAAFKKFLGRDWKGGLADLEDSFNFVGTKLDKYKLRKIFEEIEMPLLPVLAEMELDGVGVSREKLKALESKINKKLTELTKEIYALAGEEFNINSPQKVSDVLFQKLKIGRGASSLTKSGLRSTRAEKLEELKDEHKIVGPILDYREAFKMQSTYVIPLQKLVGADNRLHTEFVQTGTATGRLSSKTPNLQNIPQESIWAPELREAFEPAPGFSLVALDYSQLELRILAALSGDPKMISAFREGLDIHRVTASKVLGVPLEKIKDGDRRLAKTLNFGLIYGMGAAAFAKTSGLPRAKAEEFIGAYFKEFGEIKKWHEKIKSEARTLGYTETLTGRRRYLFGAGTDSPQLVAEAERAAINHPLQGLGADLIKMAMVNSKKELEQANLWRKDVKMILSIHDELLFEVRDDMIDSVTRLTRKIMEEVYPLSVPLEVDVYFGKDWGHLIDYRNRGL
jgi:DNA polymerase-1